VQHRAAVQGAAGGRLGRLVPQGEGALVVPEGLGQGRGRLRGLPGLDAGQQRLAQVVGGVPVVGEPALLDRGGAAGAGGAAALGDAPLQGPGVGGVQGAALHRQQVVVDGLLDERVAEHVGAGGLVDAEHVAGHGLAQQPHQLLGVLADHRRQELVVDPGAGHGRDLQDPLGRLGQGLDPGQHQVPQGQRQPGAVQVGGQQLLGEERVALGAGQDLAEQGRRGRLVQDPGQQLGQVAAAQALQLDTLGPAAAVQLGQERAQRVAAVQLVAAVGQHQGDPAAQVADQEPEQVAGGLVGPVQVLDHQQHRAALGQPVQHPEQQLEQAHGSQRGLGRPGAGRTPELGHQPGQLAAGPAQHPLQLGGVQQADQWPQRLHQRGVGRDAVADVQAAAGEGDRPAGPADQVVDQPGLADAGLARHHHDGGLAAGRPFEGRPELSGLGVAADHNRTGDSPGHASDHRRSGPRRAHARAGRACRNPHRTRAARRRPARPLPARSARTRRSRSACRCSSATCWAASSSVDTRYISSPPRRRSPALRGRASG